MDIGHRTNTIKVTSKSTPLILLFVLTIRLDTTGITNSSVIISPTK